MSSDVVRKLTTILAADAEGYSSAMVEDEVRTLGALRAARTVFAKFIERHQGRIANTAGDGLIAEFPSVVEAVQCAIEVQNELGNLSGNPETALKFRIGIHLGDVLIDGTDLLGEGVNLAARLQALAEPGGILISQQVYDQVRAKLSVGFDYLGQRRPKNFAEDVAVYRVSRGATRLPSGGSQGRPSAFRAPDRGITEQVIRNARFWGVVWVVLLAIDVVTGPPVWAYWPGFVILTFLGWRAAPLFVGGRLSPRFVRALVIVGALVVLNLMTWSGYFWAIWPAGAVIALHFLRRAVLRSR